MQEINKSFHKALGHISVKLGGSPSPDYCGDPRLVIEAMRKRWDWEEFYDFLVHECVIRELIDLIMDKTGRLAVLATEWMKEHANER